mmetsp:Transcript_46842/g.92686  ORF Transcript_46842/g.92686 Transcript_46842/m.92686 type:complete len:211 (+) Transcript_46842:59-691(+)
MHSSLAGRVAVITGASRGIGRECALALARQGCNVVIAAKSVEAKPTLPGTIYSVAEEAKSLGVDALPVQVDLRDEVAITACVEATMKRFGRIDILVNNASALWWQDIVDTPMKKYDLITSINSRGAFAMTQACLPHMEANGFGRVVTMSPPVTADINAYDSKTACERERHTGVAFLLYIWTKKKGRVNEERYKSCLSSVFDPFWLLPYFL